MIIKIIVTLLGKVTFTSIVNHRHTYTYLDMRQFQYCHRAATRSRRAQLKLVLETRN